MKMFWFSSWYKELQLTHVAFVDDLFLISVATQKSFQVINKTIREFGISMVFLQFTKISNIYDYNYFLLKNFLDHQYWWLQQLSPQSYLHLSLSIIFNITTWLFTRLLGLSRFPSRMVLDYDADDHQD